MNAAKQLDLSPRAGDYLGPATVVSISAQHLEVELRDGTRVEAQMALAYPYVPSAEDVLLLIGRDDEHWVIGVIHGKGRASLTFQGAVDIKAQGGALTLSSDEGVAIHAPKVDVETNKLTMYAGSVVQKFTSLVQRIRETMSQRAKELHTVVDDRALTTAKNASIVTEEAMTINGREIHLG